MFVYTVAIIGLACALHLSGGFLDSQCIDNGWTKKLLNRVVLNTGEIAAKGAIYPLQSSFQKATNFVHTCGWLELRRKECVYVCFSVEQRVTLMTIDVAKSRSSA